MGDKTGIAWTDATWNPIRGCSRVSEGLPERRCAISPLHGVAQTKGARRCGVLAFVGAVIELVA
jgi:protein gp37